MAKIIYGEDKEDEPIYIPSNLTILATMNTADQNVFTWNTAFKEDGIWKWLKMILRKFLMPIQIF